MSKERIHKLLSGWGVASRRAVEQMVLEGRISVNGRAVAKLPCLVDGEVDDIRLDGRRVRRPTGRNVYFLLNKPRGVVCTQSDERGRVRAADLVPLTGRRAYCVGRLDVDSTGLILLTNDGALTQYLTHPRYGVAKTYVVEVDGRPDENAIAKLKRGVYLDGGRTKPAQVRILRHGQKRSVLQIRLTEGRNREIRRVLARLGHKVRRLKRTAIGPVTDRGIKIGHFRPLKHGELRRLRRSGTKPMEA